MGWARNPWAIPSRPGKAKHARHIWSKFTKCFEKSTERFAASLQTGLSFPQTSTSTPRALEGTSAVRRDCSRYTRLATGDLGKIPCLVDKMCLLTGRV